MKQKMKQEKKTELAIKLTLTEQQARYLWWYLNTTWIQDQRHAHAILSNQKGRDKKLVAAREALCDPSRTGYRIWEKLDDALTLAHIDPRYSTKG